MQMAVPEVMDIAQGAAGDARRRTARSPAQARFANNCLLARRLVEQGVRFVQLFDWGWDMHGTGPDGDLITGCMQNKVQVYNGSAWVDLPFGTTGTSPGVKDATWTNHGVPPNTPAQPTSEAQYPTQFDLTAYKNANMRVRFGYNIASGGVFNVGSWSVDDVIVSSAICP